jgi:hypothetical protein
MSGHFVFAFILPAVYYFPSIPAPAARQLGEPEETFRICPNITTLALPPQFAPFHVKTLRIFQIWDRSSTPQAI